VNFNTSHNSIIISIVGVILGFVFYFMSGVKKTYINFIITGIPAAILITIIITYLIGGVFALFNLFLLLLRVLIFLIMSIMPISAVYGILKKQRNLLLVSSLGILCFFFLAIIISKTQNNLLIPIYSESQLPVLLLFFVLFLCYLEFGTISIFLNSSLDKMIFTSTYDPRLLYRLNRVTNKYILFTGLVLFSCYIGSMLVYWNGSNNSIFNSESIIGINFGSVYGLLFLTVVTISISILFWLFFPREKVKPEQKNQ